MVWKKIRVCWKGREEGRHAWRRRRGAKDASDACFEHHRHTDVLICVSPETPFQRTIRRWVWVGAIYLIFFVYVNHVYHFSGIPPPPPHTHTTPPPRAYPSLNFFRVDTNIQSRFASIGDHSNEEWEGASYVLYECMCVVMRAVYTWVENFCPVWCFVYVMYVCVCVCMCCVVRIEHPSVGFAVL
jgi:hypothetical protein